MRLDRRESATGEREGGPALAPGDREGSLVWRRLFDPRHPMPPPSSGHVLSAEEKERIGAWIDAGAPYATHWSFTRVERPTPPPVSDPAWVRNPIDAFVLARLDAEGLSPSPEADRATLGRRIALDLTGLPPDLEALQRFVSDDGPDALERYVDLLLASPHYGEHQAAKWLDLARYADSKGYGSDPLRTIWRWRDWVIEAYDANLPFNRFTELQMAGDLVPDADWHTQLATAFHRNTMVNTEGGTNNEEFRVAAVKDRANTTAAVWTGLTMGCAQCHSHKFDPISQEEYYAFYGLFDQTVDADADDDAPRIQTPTREQERELARLDDALVALAEQEAALGPPSAEQLSDWLARQRSWSLPLDDGPDPLVSVAGAQLPHTWQRVWDSFGRPGAERDTYPLSLVPPPGTRSLRLTAVAGEDLPNGGPGLSPGNGNFVLSELRVFARPDELALKNARFVRVALPGSARILSLAEIEVFDGATNVARSGTATQSSVDFGGPPERAIDGVTDGRFDAGSVTHTRTEDDPWWELDLGAVHTIDRLVLWNRTDGTLESRLRGATVTLLDAEREVVWESLLDPTPEPVTTLVPTEGERLRLVPGSASFEQDGWTLAMSVDGDPGSGWAIAPRIGETHEAVYRFARLPDWPFTLELELVQTYGKGHLLGRFGITFSADEGTPRAFDATTRALLDRPMEGWSAEERATVERLAGEDDPTRKALEDARRALARERAALDVVETPVLIALTPERARVTHVLAKGNFLLPEQPVAAGVPAAFASEGPVRDRLELAHWLTSRENPLTARVQVNRMWAQLFGTGLVETEEDFGAQGTPPSHSELLDWLAAEFMESGWDVKHLWRALVTSATYRQSSAVPAALLERDPRNRLFARGPRVRLSAEAVRDQALFVAGLLSPKKFGPSVYPPQPAGLWQAAFNGSDRTWETSTGEDRWRRALYTFWRRTSPYPSMQTFDAPTREVCTLRRIRTNTPLQAFVTLNDPVFVECAQALARRIVREARGDDAARAAYGFRLATARAPRPEETAELVALAADARAGFEGASESALALAGEPQGPLGDGDDPRELAAWTVVANVLLNLDEVLTKE